MSAKRPKKTVKLSPPTVSESRKAKAAKPRKPKAAMSSRTLSALAQVGRTAGAALLVLLAMGVIVSLAFYSAADPSPIHEVKGQAGNLLGEPGAALAAVAYDVFGLGAWWLVLLLLPAAWLLWSGRAAGRMLPFWAAGLGLMVSTAAVLGATGGSLSLGGAPLPVGGGAGQAVAQSLGHVGGGLAWGLPLLTAAGALGLLAWSLWPLLGPLLRSPAADGPLAEQAVAPLSLQPGSRPEPASEPEPEPEPEYEIVISRPEPAPEPVAPAAPPTPSPTAASSQNGGDGPVIKPRLAGGASASGVVAPSPKKGRFKLPNLDLLDPGPGPAPPEQAEALRATSRVLEEKLSDFGVHGAVREVAPGPVVTRFEFKPAPGVKISKVAGLADDLAMVMRAQSIRIVAPIPGKAVIGIEIPNPTREMVALRELLVRPGVPKGHRPAHRGRGQGHPGPPHGDQSGPHAPPAHRRGHRRGQERVHQLPGAVHPLPLHPGAGAHPHGGPQAHRAFRLQRHPASAIPHHHQPQGGHRRAALGGAGDGAALRALGRTGGEEHRVLQPPFSRQGAHPHPPKHRKQRREYLEPLPYIWCSSTSWPI